MFRVLSMSETLSFGNYLAPLPRELKKLHRLAKPLPEAIEAVKKSRIIP